MSSTHIYVNASTRWTNWCGAAVAEPRRVLAPRTRDEIAAIVKAAHAEGRAVKAAGSGHSFTDVAAAADMLLRLDRLDAAPVVDAETGDVTVPAGVPLRELNRILA
ncbi:MAG: FAD-binding protein, partial [Stackebrandtia sp.]